MTAFKEMFGFGSKLLLSGLLDTSIKIFIILLLGDVFHLLY